MSSEKKETMKCILIIGGVIVVVLFSCTIICLGGKYLFS